MSEAAMPEPGMYSTNNLHLRGRYIYPMLRQEWINDLHRDLIAELVLLCFLFFSVHSLVSLNYGRVTRFDGLPV